MKLYYSRDEVPTLKRRILSALPSHAEKSRPERAFLLVPLIILVLLGSAAIVVLPLPLLLRATISLMIGVLYASMLFLGHDISHGSIVRTRWLQDLLMLPCFFAFLLPPQLWKNWHVRVHHSFYNIKGRDPDIYGGTDDVEGKPLSGIVARIAPGSGHPLSALFLFGWFTIFGQVVLWSVSRKLPGFHRLRRGRAAAISGIMFILWGCIYLVVGPLNSIFVILIPMLVANGIAMAHIITNHHLRPLTNDPSPLDGSMSVTSPRAFDWIFHNFSHHTEHHLFPSMSSIYFPEVRRLLRQFVPAQYRSPSFLKALIVIYSGSRFYKDAGTLMEHADQSNQKSQLASGKKREED